MNKAILLVTFNRFDTTKKVFEQIRLVKPPKLYIASDGPRDNKVGEKELVEEIRAWLLKNVDWECEVKTRFLDKNSGGCRYGVASAITWFFENEQDGIILEDDCVPALSFFDFCEKLLDRYKDNKKVWHIGGYNPLVSVNRKESYYYSTSMHCWGWATWADRWHAADLELKDYKKEYLSDLTKSKYVLNEWQKILSIMLSDEPIDSWAYRWMFCILQNKGLCVIPTKNMVTNIGKVGVHAESSYESPFVNLPSFELEELVYNDKIKCDYKITDSFYKQAYAPWQPKCIEEIFSVKNEFNHKVIRIFGVKIKFKKKTKQKKYNLTRCQKILLNLIPDKQWQRIIRSAYRIENKLLCNVFNKNFDKKVLISYLKVPFQNGVNKTHSAFLECYTAAQIFDELGYIVDVIDYSDVVSAKELLNYDVIYGFGKSYNLALSLPVINKIFYGTGCNILYSNLKTIERGIEFFKSHDYQWCPNSLRYADEDGVGNLKYSDLIVSLGNNFVKNTYSSDGCCPKVTILNAFYFDVYDISVDDKDFGKIKNNFLWFGSMGALHKGLDIVLDIFKDRNDINLTICGLQDKETEFCDYYKDVISNSDNIKNLGFVNIDTEEFKNMMDNSVAVICPSVSEGGAVSVLNVMANGGLVPIISKQCGLDVEQYGFQVDEISKENFELAIDKLLQCDSDSIKDLSLKIKNDTRKLYSWENYKNNLKNIIAEHLSNN